MFYPPTFFKTGHRGCRGIYPENTLEGFRRAIDLGINSLELDVVVSKDRQLVVSHEPYMNPEICLKPDGSEITPSEEKQYNLYTMTYEEIKKFDCGLKIHPRFPNQKKEKNYKPLLLETLNTLEEYILKNNLSPLIYDIELKSEYMEYGLSQPFPDVFAQLVADVISKNGYSEKVILRSFDVAPLQYLHTYYPSIPLALIVENELGAKENLDKLTFLPYLYSPEYRLLTASEIFFLKQKEILVVPWTVNEETEINKLLELKVDGIITDFPNLFNKMSL